MSWRAWLGEAAVAVAHYGYSYLSGWVASAWAELRHRHQDRQPHH